MTLLNYLQSFPVLQWAILLLSVTLAVRTLMSAVQVLISLKYSKLSKSQKQSLTSFLAILENCSTEIIPSLSQALKTVLLNKGLLSSQNQNNSQELQEAPEQMELQEEVQQADESSALDSFIEFIKAFKEVKK